MWTKWGWFAIVVLALGCLAGCAWAGWYFGRRTLRVEAIQAGHAKHVIMDEYGHTSFQWLEKGDK